MNTHKGDWSRVNDHKSYQDNYESIFRRKEDKGQEVLQVCAEADQARRSLESNIDLLHIPSDTKEDQEIRQAQEHSH